MGVFTFVSFSIWAVLFAVFSWIAMLLVRYDLEHLFHAHVSMVAELAIGILLNGVLAAITIVVWVLVQCGVLS